MKVIATKHGFFGGIQRAPGDSFDVPEDAKPASWFKPVNAKPKTDEDLTKLPEPKGRTDEQKQVDADEHFHAEAQRIHARASDSPGDLTVDQFKEVAKEVKAEEKHAAKPEPKTLSEIGKQPAVSPLAEAKTPATGKKT